MQFRLASLALAALPLLAVAQLPDVSSIPECVLNCTQQGIAEGGCASLLDISCFCTSESFQSATGACLQANCTEADQQTGLALQQAQCNATGASSTTGSPSSTSSGASSSPSGTSAAPSSTSSTTGNNGAAGFSGSSVAALAAVLVGAIAASL